MTSGAPFPRRFSKVDELALPNHFFLSEDDNCYYIGEYTAQKGYSYSATNSLISNFKKEIDRKGSLQWHYKAEAIQRVAATFKKGIKDTALKSLTFVPVPPSKSKDDPLYDDRMTQMLLAIDSNLNLDVREMVVQSVSTPAAHLNDERPRPDELIDLYSLDESLTDPAPTSIAIVDDLLTTGSHFRAMKTILVSRFPFAYMMGLFIARRVPDTDEPEDSN